MTDYGVEIVPARRVSWVDRFVGMRTGTVLRVDDGCHWDCRETDALWRPRAAYVIPDDGRIQRSSGCPDAPADEIVARYVEPENLSAMPDGWLHPLGLRRVSPRDLLAPELGVVRRDERGAWWLLNRRDRGWGEFGYPHGSLGELCARWRCVPERMAGADVHGLYWRIAAVLPPRV